jgi:hypothetical protein
MNEKIEFSELVFRLPMNTGVFWVRTGDKWRRCSKYEFPKEEPFTADSGRLGRRTDAEPVAGPEVGG